MTWFPENEGFLYKTSQISVRVLGCLFILFCVLSVSVFSRLYLQETIDFKIYKPEYWIVHIWKHLCPP